MKILSKNEDGTFVVRFDNMSEDEGLTKISIIHDYVRFKKKVNIDSLILIENCPDNIDLSNNYITFNFTIGIRTMILFVMKSFKKSKYLKKKHIEEKDSYVHYDESVQIYDNDTEEKVISILVPGESEIVKVDKSFYEYYKKLKLTIRKYAKSKNK